MVVDELYRLVRSIVPADWQVTIVEHGPLVAIDVAQDGADGADLTLNPNLPDIEGIVRRWVNDPTVREWSGLR